MEANEPKFYRVWGADNVAYGPVELPALVGWIKDERILSDSWVFVDDDRLWRKASQWPELAMFFNTRSSTVSPCEGESRAAPLGEKGLTTGALRRLKILAEFDERQLESFLRYMEVESYKPFAQVVRQGEPGGAMYLVLEGELRARILIDGKETTLSTLHVGDFFGEISILDQGPRSADVIANQPSVLLRISADAFTKLVREAPALATPFLLALSRSVVGRVRALTKKYQDSVHFSRTAGQVKPD